MKIAAIRTHFAGGGFEQINTAYGQQFGFGQDRRPVDKISAGFYTQKIKTIHYCNGRHSQYIICVGMKAIEMPAPPLLHIIFGRTGKSKAGPCQQNRCSKLLCRAVEPAVYNERTGILRSSGAGATANQQQYFQESVEASQKRYLPLVT